MGNFLVRATVVDKEAEALKKGFTKSEIPPQYKNLKMIGQGNTCVVLEKDENTVIMLTRDSMKKDWLHWGLKISKEYEVHEIKSKRREFDDLSVFAIELPKLRKPTGANLKKIADELAFFKKAQVDLKMPHWDMKRDLNKLATYYEEQGQSESLIGQVVTFLMDYNPDQYNFDIAKRQFLEDMQGNLILIDPIVDMELFKVMFQVKESRW